MVQHIAFYRLLDTSVPFGPKNIHLNIVTPAFSRRNAVHYRGSKNSSGLQMSEAHFETTSAKIACRINPLFGK